MVSPASSRSRAASRYGSRSAMVSTTAIAIHVHGSRSHPARGRAAALRPALIPRCAGKRQDGVDVTAHRRAAHMSCRQLDHEGGVAGERGVLPGGKAAGKLAVVAKRKADETGVVAFDASIAARVVDQ